MKKLKLGLVLGLALVLVSVFALPGSAVAKKKIPLIQQALVIE